VHFCREAAAKELPLLSVTHFGQFAAMWEDQVKTRVQLALNYIGLRVYLEYSASCQFNSNVWKKMSSQHWHSTPG